MSENTQINVSTTTEIVNVDVTETLQPVSLECFFANGSAQDTVVNVSETVQNIELNVTETQAQNVEIDFTYPSGPVGPQGPAGSSLWGTISGTLSAQTDLWKYLSAVGTSNFDIATLNNYLSTNNILLSSLNVNGQILSAGVPLHNIFLTSETDSQILSYNTQTELLSISNGNSVSLASLNDKNYINSNFLALSGGIVSGPVRINNNLTVFGNLTASGTTTFANTVFSVTSALSVVHIGSGPAVWVGNNGDGDIASFYDINQNIEILHVGGINSSFPNVGIKTSSPNKTLTVNGEISANSTIYDNAGNSSQWNSTYQIVSTLSAFWEESADIIPTVTNYLSTSNVTLCSINVEGVLSYKDINISDIFSNTKYLFNDVILLDNTQRYIYYGNGYQGINELNGVDITFDPDAPWTRWFVNLGNGPISGTNYDQGFEIYVYPNEIKKINYNGTSYSVLELYNLSNSQQWDSVYTTFTNNSANYILQGGNTLNSNLSVGTTNTRNLILETNNQARVTILSSGSVGIGTSAANQRLTVAGNISATGIIYTNNDIEITDSTKGIIHRSPNGNRWRTTITDSGTLSSVQI